MGERAAGQAQLVHYISYKYLSNSRVNKTSASHSVNEDPSRGSAYLAPQAWPIHSLPSNIGDVKLISRLQLQSKK